MNQASSITSSRPASTLELFFDLVYVFAITQVVALLHEGASIGALAEGAMILWLLWWTWSIYTWTTNWSGTDATGIRLFLLASMGATLFMALAIPEAFGDSSQWFGAGYFVVRVFANTLFWYASKDHPRQRKAFFSFFPISFAAALLVLVGGLFEPPWLVVLWLVSALLDVLSALNAGKAVWSLDTHHFAERNGLFIIVALGETIVGIGLAAVGVERDFIHLAAIVTGFSIAAALWWAYFHRAALLLEKDLEESPTEEVGAMARDAYSLLHYPLVVGIVFYAVAAEEVVAHPSDSLDTFGRLALSLGVSMALLAIAAAVYRVERRIPTARIAAAAVIMAIGAAAGSWSAVVFAAFVAATAIASLAWTTARPWTAQPQDS